MPNSAIPTRQGHSRMNSAVAVRAGGSAAKWGKAMLVGVTAGVPVGKRRAQRAIAGKIVAFSRDEKPCVDGVYARFPARYASSRSCTVRPRLITFRPGSIERARLTQNGGAESKRGGWGKGTATFGLCPARRRGGPSVALRRLGSGKSVRRSLRKSRFAWCSSSPIHPFTRSPHHPITPSPHHPITKRGRRRVPCRGAAPSASV